MHFGVFSYAYSTNLGDEIQTLSAMQYLPRVDTLLERDRLHWYRDSPPVFVIFNGWFTRLPSWPPPDCISPLFVAFHAARPELLIDKRFVGYFKRHEPIGCRSLATLEAFRAIGVDAYFSGCLTLTLQRQPVERTGEIYAVDVEMGLYEKLVPERIRQMAIPMSHEFPNSASPLLTRVKWNAAYLGLRGIYKWGRGGLLLRGAGDKLNRTRHAYRLSQAQALLRKYSAAKLVITSRLHCALPCLAMGTPVLLLRPDIDADPRFDGLRDLVRFHSDPNQAIRIDWEHPEPNPDAYLHFAAALRERCRGVVSRVLGPEGARDTATCLTAARVN